MSHFYNAFLTYKVKKNHYPSAYISRTLENESNIYIQNIIGNALCFQLKVLAGTPVRFQADG